MANIELLVPKILKYEGGFVQDPDDKGGATNMGITLVTFQHVFGADKTADDLKKLTVCDFREIMKIYFWDRWLANQILNQSVAELLVDWVWASGKWGIIIPQRIIGVKADDKVGPDTISHLNGMDQPVLHEKIRQARFDFINNIVKQDPSQQKYLHGWSKRISDYQFEAC
jgi:lysozyme family protein